MTRYLIPFWICSLLFSCTEENVDTSVVKNEGATATFVRYKTTPPELDKLLFDSLAVDCFYHLGYSTGGEFYAKTGFESIHHTLIEILDKHGANHSDIIFLIDKTGSMQNDIDSVRINLNLIIDKIQNFDDIQLGIAAYGDRIVDGVTWFESSQLSDNYSLSRNFINNLKVSNGGDYPESVYDGLAKLIQETPWRTNSKRMILVIGDAPSLEDSLTNYSRKEILELCNQKDITANIFPVLVSPYTFEMFDFYETFTPNIKFKIYPNPANDYFNLETNSDSVGFVSLTSMKGEVVLTNTVENDISRVDLPESLHAGIYLVRIEDKTGVFLKSEKLVISR